MFWRWENDSVLMEVKVCTQTHTDTNTNTNTNTNTHTDTNLTQKIQTQASRCVLQGCSVSLCWCLCVCAEDWAVFHHSDPHAVCSHHRPHQSETDQIILKTWMELPIATTMVLQLSLVFSTLISITGSSDVVRRAGSSVQLDIQHTVPQFYDLSWVFNRTNNVLKYYYGSKAPRQYPAYEHRVEFNMGTYNLTLRNLQDTDSGLYQARASGNEVTVVAEYRLSVRDYRNSAGLNSATISITLGISSPLCSWIMDFLTCRPQCVRMGEHTSPSITLSTGCPQGIVLSPLLYTLYTHDCTTTYSSNTTIKFADDTTIIGNITNDDEGPYREEVKLLTEWCSTNNLSLNVSKTKELIIDFRKGGRTHTPLNIGGTLVERVSSFKFLGVHLAEDLTWTTNTSHLVRKAQQRLHFLPRLRRVNLPQQLLCNFYRSTVESILTSCITVWYGSATSAEHIAASTLPPIQDIYDKRCLRKSSQHILRPPTPQPSPLPTSALRKENRRSSDVFRLVGGSVQLDTQHPVPEFDDLSWIFNGNINVLKYFNETTKTHHSPGYEDRVEFSNRTYSLTLKNLQKTDSGLYEARASDNKVTVVAEYSLSVLGKSYGVESRAGKCSPDPVEDPVLTHQLNNDTCNITLTCRGHDLSFNSSCYDKTCEEKNKTSPGGVTLSLSVRGSSIICNHSNPVSWKNKTLEMGELTRPCTDGRKGEHGAQGDDSKSTVVVVSVVALAVVVIIFISVYVYRRRSSGVSEEQLYSSVPGVSGNPQPGLRYAAVVTTNPETVEMSTVSSAVKMGPQCTSTGESSQTRPDPENECVHVLKPTYSHEFLLDASRNRLLEFNSEKSYESAVCSGDRHHHRTPLLRLTHSVGASSSAIGSRRGKLPHTVALAMAKAVTVAALFCLVSISGSSDVFRSVGVSLQLDVQPPVPEFDDLSWIFNKTNNIIKHYSKPKNTKHYGYEDRVEFNEGTYSLTLKNLQKTDSGLYEARVSDHNVTSVAKYRLSVLARRTSVVSSRQRLSPVRCRPFYLPREFTTVLIVSVYIPPGATAKAALCELYSAISRLQNTHPDGLFIVAGDFNHGNLKSVLPKFHQHVNFATRGANALDLVYTNIPSAYRAEPRPHLGYSDHISVMLIPAYRPLVRRSKPVLKQVRTWPSGAISALQDCFEHTDWQMFREAATYSTTTDLEEYTSSVTSYIGKCIDDVTVTTRPNQKPWMTAEALRKARAKLSQGIREAKRFTYRPNRSTDDAISTTLHLALTHLDNRDTYVGMLFIDFSSAFNTIIPQHLIGKLNLLGLNTSLSNWILDFLTGRPHPLLFTLLTHDCAAMHSSNHIIKFADDTTVVGLISKNDESAYREEVQRLTDWCRTNNLSLNVDKTKEMVVDFRRTRRDHSPLHIDGSTVEIVKSTKFLGVHLAEDLTWSLNTSTIKLRLLRSFFNLHNMQNQLLRTNPVEAPVLTHQVNRTTCNITLTCRGHDLSINSSCYNETCEEKEVTSAGGVILSLSVRGSSIICNHSNPASWKNETLEMGKRSCTDGGVSEDVGVGVLLKTAGYRTTSVEDLV
ncbi:hypothetical protein NFI96_011889 [Prochilodus magdalenae]|nr:hypothetical protein NFI96_011889 [Prochilodus magdalenae]